MNNTKHYNWNEIQSYYDEGHTLNECKVKFGFHHAAWTKAVNRGDIKPRLPSGNAELLPLDKLKSRFGVKQRLIKNGTLPYACSLCGIDTWKGETLPLHLDHVDGNRYNNNPENLRLLCPNCHALEPTSNGKNKGRYALQGH